MKVFVTGGTGLVGKVLVKRLLKSGAQVSMLVRNPEKAAFLEKLGAQLIEGSLDDLGWNSAVLAGVDLVVHCAALTEFWGIPWLEYYQHNVVGTRTLLTACQQQGCPNVVHLSTTLLYGASADDGEKNEQSVPPLKLPGYERSKLLSERVALEYVRRGMNLKIVRLTSLYASEGRFIETLVEGLQGKKLKIIGAGENKKHLTHVTDAVEGILLAAECGAAGEIYNIGAEDVPSLNGIFNEMAHQLKVEPPDRVPRFLAKCVAGAMELVCFSTGKTPPLTRYLVDYMSLHHNCCIRKAREELGFMPRYGFREGIGLCVEEYLSTRC